MFAIIPVILLIQTYKIPYKQALKTVNFLTITSIDGHLFNRY